MPRNVEMKARVADAPRRRELAGKLGVTPEDLVEGAYIDLLEQA